MESEWFVAGGAVVAAMGMFYFGWRLTRKAPKEKKTSMDEESMDEESMGEKTSVTPDAPDESPKTDPFSKKWWAFPVSDKPFTDGSLSPARVDDHLPMILLQDIRNDANLYAIENNCLQREILAELQSINRYMRQLYGPD